jgi:hypothetical protein
MPDRIVQVIGRERHVSLEIPSVDYGRVWRRGVVRDMSRGRDYACHLYVEPTPDDSLRIEVRAFPRVTWDVAHDKLNEESPAFAERLGRLHFFTMPRTLVALEQEVRSWQVDAPQHVTPASLAFHYHSYQLGCHEPYQKWTGWHSPYYVRERVAIGALRDSSLPARLEGLLHRMDYERAKVTLTYDF